MTFFLLINSWRRPGSLAFRRTKGNVICNRESGARTDYSLSFSLCIFQTKARSAEGSEDNGFGVTFHILRDPACAGQTGEQITTIPLLASCTALISCDVWHRGWTPYVLSHLNLNWNGSNCRPCLEVYIISNFSYLNTVCFLKLEALDSNCSGAEPILPTSVFYWFVSTRVMTTF